MHTLTFKGKMPKITLRRTLHGLFKLGHRVLSYYICCTFREDFVFIYFLLLMSCKGDTAELITYLVMWLTV